jgi:hypothetical protein
MTKSSLTACYTLYGGECRVIRPTGTTRITECGSSSRYRQFGRELDSRYDVGLSLERRGRLVERPLNMEG